MRYRVVCTWACALALAGACGNKSDRSRSERSKSERSKSEREATDRDDDEPALELPARVLRSQWAVDHDTGKPVFGVTVLISGSQAVSSVAYGQIELANANLADETLESRMKLRNRDYPGTNDKGIELEVVFLWGIHKDVESTGRFEGTITLRVPAKTEHVVIEDPRAYDGKTLTGVGVDELGIELRVVDGTTIRLTQTKGALGALESASLLDAASGAEAPTERTTDVATKLPVIDVAHADAKPLDGLKLSLTINRELEQVRARFYVAPTKIPRGN